MQSELVITEKGIPSCDNCSDEYKRAHCIVCAQCNSRHCAFAGKGDGCNFCQDSGD